MASPAPASIAPGPIAPADLAGLPGLALMQGMFDGRYPPPPISQLMAMHGNAAGEGWVSFIGHPGPEHYNPIGSVHGGYAATLLDSCMGCAVHTTLAAGIGYTTIDLNITYIRGMTAETGAVTARGEVISSGRRVATARGTLTDAKGRVLATGTTTCLIFPLEPPK
ncbi:MAG: PaaI family thioesterase [Sandarakinorhabdus sp.]|nr:PaaI family thioesterase [Sandarakinorhabdus sp.]